jgi:hypothetical protein
MSMKIFQSLLAAGMLLNSLWAGAVDRPNNNRVREDDPVTICQKKCQGVKGNESYEACMLKCKETEKSASPVTLPQKK